MHANVGDRIVIRGHRIRERVRVCEVLEVRGPDGGSPYVVRWSDDGHEGLFFPGPDADVEPPGHDSPA
ncbi:MAG TPA: DUF1918 domain-containing protein [Microthrixaceae bacterium]|nr:DUF1918 domain-containing protein [Microthrixaceae bacterium]